jgi:hypothetical protein
MYKYSALKCKLPLLQLSVHEWNDAFPFKKLKNEKIILIYTNKIRLYLFLLNPVVFSKHDLPYLCENTVLNLKHKKM